MNSFKTASFSSCAAFNDIILTFQRLYRATGHFRANHFIRHGKAREEMVNKVRTLKVLKTHQLRELQLLMKTKEEVQQTLARLAERYEETKDAQENLAKRYEGEFI